MQWISMQRRRDGRGYRLCRRHPREEERREGLRLLRLRLRLRLWTRMRMLRGRGRAVQQGTFRATATQHGGGHRLRGAWHRWQLVPLELGLRAQPLVALPRR